MPDPNTAPPSWPQRHDEIAQTAARQLFFIGGAPRSGTTWLQQILNAHPDICCHGEGLFQKHLIEPLETLMAARRDVLDGKNKALFGHTGGYPLPHSDDVDLLVRTAILLGLSRQCRDRSCLAIGEKTPENVFQFPRFRHLFPNAKFIAIARDPRDVLTSAWHYFHRPVAGEDEIEAKLGFIRSALPSLAEGARAMLSFAERYPADCQIVTYESLQRDPELNASRLFRFLGVGDSPELAAECIALNSFASLSGGRSAGEERNGSFFRKGVVGDWRGTLTTEMNEIILHDLGWTFPHFGY